MKVFVVTIDEVYGFENGFHNPKVFLNKENAERYFKFCIEDTKNAYKNELDSAEIDEYGDVIGWTCEESENSFVVYENGNYAENHNEIVLFEVETQD